MEQAVEAAIKIASSDRRLSYYRGVVLVLEKQDAAAAEKDFSHLPRRGPRQSEPRAHSSAYEWLRKLYESEKEAGALTLDPQNKGLREALTRLQEN